MTDYRELDKMNAEQDLFLALAIYDWNFFGDARIQRLKAEYGVTTKNEDIFTYYYTDRGYIIGLNHDRYIRKHRELLQAVLYN